MRTHDVEAFRSRYRADIWPHYSAWLHGGFVLAYGLVVIVVFGFQLTELKLWDWLALPLGLVVFNVGEYVIHRWWGHHKRLIGGLFYKRHTGDHHSFFVAGRMSFDGAQDWRVILFPAWLIVLFSVFVCIPAWWLGTQVFSPEFGALLGATLMAGYLMYEFFHACQHLPRQHWLLKLPWLRHMAHLHELHHRRDYMQHYNFNLVLPLTDWLLGSLRWTPPDVLEQQAPLMVVVDERGPSEKG